MSVHDDTTTEYLLSSDAIGGGVSKSKIDLTSKISDQTAELLTKYRDVLVPMVEFFEDFGKLAGFPTQTGTLHATAPQMKRRMANGQEDAAANNRLVTHSELCVYIGTNPMTYSTVTAGNAVRNWDNAAGPPVHTISARIIDIIKTTLKFATGVQFSHAAGGAGDLVVNDANMRVPFERLERNLDLILSRIPQAGETRRFTPDPLADRLLAKLTKDQLQNALELHAVANKAEALLGGAEKDDVCDVLDSMIDKMTPHRGGAFAPEDEPLHAEYQHLRKQIPGMLKSIGKGIDPEWRPTKDEEDDEKKAQEAKLTKKLMLSSLQRREQLVKLVHVIMDSLGYDEFQFPEGSEDSAVPSPVPRAQGGRAGTSGVTSRRSILSQKF